MITKISEDDSKLLSTYDTCYSSFVLHFVLHEELMRDYHEDLSKLALRILICQPLLQFFFSFFLFYYSLSGDSERILTDLLNSPGFSSDFFSLDEDKFSTEKAGDTVRIACFDIGNYRPEDMTLRVEGDHVLLQGKRTQRINMGVEGAKFSRAIPIPEGVNPKRITARYNALDGQYIVEGVKEKSSPCRRRKTSSAYFDESRMTLTVELGSPRAQELVYANNSLGTNRAEGAVRNSSRVNTTTDKVVI